MKKKKKISVQTIIEVMIRAVFFIIYPALFSTAFTGIKLIVEQITQRASLQWNSFVQTLVVLLVFTIVFGRFFCGFACAFGTWGDFVYFISSMIRKKRKKKPLKCFSKAGKILRYLKYVVLLVVLLLCIKGYSSAVAVHSPFSAFSRFHQLKMADSLIGTGLFLLVTAGMALEPRFFCRFLCPMGAVFSLMPVLPFSVIKRNRENCIPKCKACNLVCSANLEIPLDKEGDNATSGECFSCGKCIGKCPKQNTHNGLPGKLWLPMLVGKAVILFVIFRILY